MSGVEPWPGAHETPAAIGAFDPAMAVHGQEHARVPQSAAGAVAGNGGFLGLDGFGRLGHDGGQWRCSGDD